MVLDFERSGKCPLRARFKSDTSEATDGVNRKAEGGKTAEECLF